ncbi:MAG TPA: NYN domain-containing protein [Thermoanaerobaculia bacterium]|nr:NYN domain-containing protein [Thermoanaerobaculia bacterium]
MDRCAVFVDAGHLLAEGGKLCCGTRRRSAFKCDYAGMAAALTQFASAHCQLPLLRTYWYDAAPDAVPTKEHLDIAELPAVKLRLGRLVGAQQKGVDSLIVRDLMTLARTRAVATVFLLGGDEDLREGVLAAQEMGVLVVVVGIPAAGPGNQARSLIREADKHVVLETAFLARFFSKQEPALGASQTNGQAVPPPVSGPHSEGEKARLIGRDVATYWARLATESEVQKLLTQAPVIPRELDVQLVVEAEQSLGSLRARRDLKKDLRAGFWSALKDSVPPAAT